MSRSIDEIIKAQGWTNDTLVDLLYAYIENQGSMDALADFFEAAAAAGKTPSGTRVTAELSPSAFERLVQLRGSLDLSSNVEVLRRALQVLSMLCAEVSNGSRVHLVRSNGDIVLLDPLVKPAFAP